MIFKEGIRFFLFFEIIRKKTVYLAIALTLLSSNIIFNIPVSSILLSEDLSVYLPIFIVFHALTLGITSIIFYLALKEKLPIIRLYHALLFFIIIEAAFRLIIFSPVLSSVSSLSILKKPSLYFQIYDDRFWVLHDRYKNFQSYDKTTIDPQLGWISQNENQEKNELNSNGTKYKKLSDIQKRPLLFYGDSMVASVTSEDAYITTFIEKKNDNYSAINLGVGGYGVGQIIRRFELDYPDYKHLKPKVLIGIYLLDIYRTPLQFRGSQKSYFSIDDDKLNFNQVKYKTNKDYIENFSFSTTIFTVSLAKNFFQRMTRRFYINKSIVNLNYEIIKYAKQFIEKNNVDATFVLMYDSYRALQMTSEEQALKDIFEKLELDYIDTKISITEYLNKNNLPYKSLWFSPSDMHLNDIGNEVLAEQIIGHFSFKD